MIADLSLLYQFEMGLRPQRLKDTAIPAASIGYKEISAIFKVGTSQCGHSAKPGK